MPETPTPKPTEAEDAAGFAQTAMEAVVQRENFRDGLEAMGALTDAVVWLAAETRAARLEQQDLPERVENAIAAGGQIMATSVWDALRK